ncbi:MAG: hypothetical protein WCL44_06675 [bacterium]
MKYNSYYLAVMHPTKNLDRASIDAALTLLGERLEQTTIAPVCLLVCGGASLIATRMVSRLMTKDIDVVAFVRDNAVLDKAKPFPPLLDQCVSEVAAMLQLPPSWMNPGPTALLDAGLPEGLMDRVAETRHYGSRLTVLFIGRRDQICFKVYAAADAGPGRHLEDLRELKPTADEMETAARWVTNQDPSEGFRMMLREMYRKIGYEQIADRI